MTNVRTFPMSIAKNQLERLKLDLDYLLLSLNEVMKDGDEVAKAKLMKELEEVQSEINFVERAMA